MDPAPSHEITKGLQDRWVWTPGWIDAPLHGESSRLVTFRREFVLFNALDKPTFVRVSADTRYKLVVNGQRVMVGPSRGSDKIWYYDTIDIGPYLQQGTNEVIVHVLRFFPAAVAGIAFARTALPGFTLTGSIEGQDISTGKSDSEWRCREEDHVHLPTGSKCDIFLHVYEQLRPISTERPWTSPKAYRFIGHYGIVSNWRMESRMIPAFEESDAPFKTVRDANSPLSVDKWEQYLRGGSLTLPPNTQHRIELEFAVHSTAFLTIGGISLDKDSTHDLSITYSECYESDDRDKKALKGDRTKREGQRLVGPSDTIQFRGSIMYEPFWWRTFRFIVLELSVGDAPLELSTFKARQCNYPLAVTAEWIEPDGSESASLWDISIRTMRNCMFDGYSDCPFYEQLQYCEDARSAMLFHYILSGDDRLARQTIIAFAASVQPDGLICGRYPAHGTQIIVGFALFWVLQVCDHHMHFNDGAFVTRFLPIIHSVLDCFERHTSTENGLVTGFPDEYWSFVDWHSAWDGDEEFLDPGVPATGRRNRTWSFFSMLYAYTLREVCAMLGYLDRPALVGIYAQRAARTSAAVKKHCFDGTFFTESTLETSAVGNYKYSAHAQIWGVLSKSLDPAIDEASITHAKTIITSALSDPDAFAKCSYPMTHYAFRALAKVGAYDQFYQSMWKPWRAMMSCNLTTWAEDDVTARSDCHEWSSLPIWEFATEVAGLKPIEPGWASISFTPRVSLYPQVDTKLNLGARGLAHVKWKATEHGEISISLDLPGPLRVVSRLPSREKVDHGEVSTVRLVYQTKRKRLSIEGRQE